MWGFEVMYRCLAVLGIILIAASACEHTPRRPLPIDVVSIQYDPYNYSMAELSRSANAACAAKGGSRAIAVNNELNTESVRWAYMNFECY